MKASIEVWTDGVIEFGCNRSPSPVMLGYSLRNPLAVTMSVLDTPWVFSRDLLSGGAPGLGDVGIEWQRDSIVVTLMPTGQDRASVRMLADEVQDFVEQTYVLCPAGQEFYDVDSWIRGFRGQEADEH